MFTHDEYRTLQKIIECHCLCWSCDKLMKRDEAIVEQVSYSDTRYYCDECVPLHLVCNNGESP